VLARVSVLRRPLLTPPASSVIAPDSGNTQVGFGELSFIHDHAQTVCVLVIDYG